MKFKLDNSMDESDMSTVLLSQSPCTRMMNRIYENWIKVWMNTIWKGWSLWLVPPCLSQGIM